MSDSISDSGETGKPANTLVVRTSINSGQLFWTLVRYAMLQFITLGIYRFWATTKLRRYIWGNIVIGDDRVEYHGTPIELFKGFLVTLVLLGPIIALFQGLAYSVQLDADFLVDVLFAALLLILWSFAFHRALKYRASRTSWRSIRFSLRGSSLRYAVYAFAWNTATILTLGLIWPHACMAKLKYLMESIQFADLRFSMDFRKEGLFKHWLVTWAIGLLLCLPVPLIFIFWMTNEYKAGDTISPYFLLQPFYITVFLPVALAVLFSFASIIIHRYFIERLMLEDASFSTQASFKPVLQGIIGLICLVPALSLISLIGYLVLSDLLNVNLSAVFTENSGGFSINTLKFVALGGLVSLAFMIIVRSAYTTLIHIQLIKQKLRLTIANSQNLSLAASTQDKRITHGEGLVDALDIGEAF